MAKVSKRASTKAPSRNVPAKRKTTATKASATRARPPQAKAAKTGKGRSAGTRVMGMRVPKTLTSALDSLVNSPQGREILASALVAAATAAAAALVKKSDSRQVAKAQEAAAEVGDQVATATKDLSQVAAGALAEIVTGAARSFLPASRKAKGQGPD